MANPPLDPADTPLVQLAAGGIVWRRVDGRWKLAVLHRPRYDDWSLPKGKPEPNEQLGETARREVREEVGCEIRFREFAGTTTYSLGSGRLKVVLYWHMLAVTEPDFHPNDEVDQVLWLTPEEAVQTLDYDVERELLAKAPSGLAGQLGEDPRTNA